MHKRARMAPTLAQAGEVGEAGAEGAWGEVAGAAEEAGGDEAVCNKQYQISTQCPHNQQE